MSKAQTIKYTVNNAAFVEAYNDLGIELAERAVELQCNEAMVQSLHNETPLYAFEVTGRGLPPEHHCSQTHDLCFLHKHAGAVYLLVCDLYRFDEDDWDAWSAFRLQDTHVLELLHIVANR